MKNDIERLKQAQVLDSEIYGAKQLLDEIPLRLRELDQAVESEKKKLLSFEEELRSIQLQQKQKEADLQDRESKIKKYEIQLDQVKTNKEYSALQTEIRSLKADNSLLEEGIIELFDRVDSCQAKLKTEKERLAGVDTEAKAKRSTLEQQAKEAEKRICELSAKRKELIEGVDSEIASLYEKIVKSKRGLALTRIDGEVCSACHVQLRPQQINEIRMGEKVVLCEQCSRILYCE